jgi:hypothetical protein
LEEEVAAVELVVVVVHLLTRMILKLLREKDIHL